MTVNKQQKITAITTLSALVLSIGLMPIAFSQDSSIETTSKRPLITDEYLQEISPENLSEKDLDEYHEIILDSNKIQPIIGDKSYNFTSYGFIGNVYDVNVVWYPEIHLTVEVTSDMYRDIAIVMNPQTKTIRHVQIVEFDSSDKNGQYNGYSSQRFTGHSGTPDGVKVDMESPTFTWDQNSRSKGNVLLLNALMDGSTWSSACTSSSIPSTYWAQIGFYWKDSGKINWSDTEGNCFPQFPSLTYADDETYEFRIVGATSGWAYYATRVSTGDTWTTRGPEVNSADMETPTNNDGTSVFFENKYSSSEPSWYGQFNDAPQASNAQYKTQPFGSYSDWSNTKLVDKDCNNNSNVYPYDSSKEVMNGDLKNGGTATWDVNRMETYYPNC